MKPKTLTQRVAAELRAEMARQSLSVAQVSAKTGIARSTLAHRLAGQRALDTDQLAAITDYLGVSVADVVHRASPTHPLERVG